MEICDELRSFEATGVYRLDGTGATFLDPVRLLNGSYQRFRVVPSAYYSRSFEPPPRQVGDLETEQPEKRRKRKRNQKPKPRELNAMERIAEARHQEARPLLLSAHESLIKDKQLLEYLSKTTDGKEHTPDAGSVSENNFVELGTSWRAPFYEITICFRKPHILGNWEGSFDVQKTSFSLFNSIINVEAIDEAEGEFQNRHYILPRESCFLMTDFKHVRDLIPGRSNQGYNLIVVDPPWENGCVRQKEAEKLWVFVEQELLPTWGVKDPTVFYWLKVKPDGSLIGDLDLFHHRPYECLLLGYINVNTDAKQGSNFKLLEGSQVIMSVPGAHSRKPPLEKKTTAPDDGAACNCCRTIANKPLTPGCRTENPPKSSRNNTLQLQMPGVTSESPELRRIRTAQPTAPSQVASARVKLAERAKAPANSKAKGLDDQEKRCKSCRGESGKLVPSARRRSSPPSPPVGPDAGRTRCSWITANSDPQYAAFHDDEWGVPVHDDRTLFELLTLSQALAELTWPAILSKREEFREMFDGFNPASISEFTEKKITMLRSNASVLLPEQKIRAVVTNAKQMRKVVQEFGSFSNYCWSFVNHKPIRNCFRYARQVPTKTPKAEAISKDLMRRGFQFKACSEHKASETIVRAEPALPDRRLSSLSSEDSDIREM
nr:unnamed protein product [Digitaria exilis]CAB3501718.1 unnamed protein product [Digitaria exilis]